jgi:DNA (cytosine-5)-methyltransferase 1
MKILNLYACLGGNRYKWNEVKDDIEVTAVEKDLELAKLYKQRFPNDKVVLGDAHEYLLHNYKNFDFIWSSPPCPTHSRARFARRNTTTSLYPDMTLYQEIILLKHYFKGKYCVENVMPFYDSLIPGKQRGRHLYWTNFRLPSDLKERKCSIMKGKNEVKRWSEFHEYEFNKYKGKQRLDKIARNLVDYEAGKAIFQTLIDIKQNKVEQIGLFK